MASVLSETIARVRARIRELGEQKEALQAELMRRDSEVEALRHDMRQLQQKLERLESDNKFLRISYRLAATPDDIVHARRLISGLIRNIDKCISEIKE